MRWHLLPHSVKSDSLIDPIYLYKISNSIIKLVLILTLTGVDVFLINVLLYK